MNEKITELLLIRTLPDKLLPKIKNSRLKGLYTKLMREINKELSKQIKPPDPELRKIFRRINHFCLDTNWLDSAHHETFISFCAELIKNSPYDHNPKISAVLTEILTHFENIGELKTACCWKDSIAFEKWKGEDK